MQEREVESTNLHIFLKEGIKAQQNQLVKPNCPSNRFQHHHLNLNDKNSRYQGCQNTLLIPKYSHMKL